MRLNSDILIHHISASWIPLFFLTPPTFLHSWNFWSPLIPSPELLRSDFTSVGLPVLFDKCHMQPGKYPCSTLSRLFLSSSAAYSCRSCHQAQPNANLNPFSFIQSFSYSESLIACRRCCSCSTTLYYLLSGRVAAGEHYTLLQIPSGLARVHWNIIFCTLPVHIISKHIWL